MAAGTMLLGPIAALHLCPAKDEDTILPIGDAMVVNGPAREKRKPNGHSPGAAAGARNHGTAMDQESAPPITHVGDDLEPPLGVVEGPQPQPASSEAAPAITVSNQPPSSAEAAGVARFRGFVDGVDSEWRLCGWACDRTGGTLTVELVEDGTVLTSAVAKGFRQDLLEAGYGSGKCAFYVPLPQALFDAVFHRLQVVAVAGDHREPIHEPFGVVLPRIASRTSTIPAKRIWEQVIGEPATTPRPDAAAIAEMAQVFQKLGLRFGHSAALRLLYVYVLQRHIDNDGLMSRLVRLNGNIAEYGEIVAEVINSSEAAQIHEPTGYRTLHPLNHLLGWLDERFGIIGVRNELLL